MGEIAWQPQSQYQCGSEAYSSVGYGAALEADRMGFREGRPDDRAGPGAVSRWYWGLYDRSSLLMPAI